MFRFVTVSIRRAHGVVVSHPLSMREALGSIPSVSMLRCPGFNALYAANRFASDKSILEIDFPNQLAAAVGKSPGNRSGTGNRFATACAGDLLAIC